jgi:hypothetical protein
VPEESSTTELDLTSSQRWWYYYFYFYQHAWGLPCLREFLLPSMRARIGVVGSKRKLEVGPPTPQEVKRLIDARNDCGGCGAERRAWRISAFRPDPPPRSCGLILWRRRSGHGLLGHSSIVMTLDLIYGHLFPRGDDQGELAAAARRLLG